MQIELLYFDDCPSFEALRLRVEQVLLDQGCEALIELVRVASLDEAEAKLFLGSPTLRVYGRCRCGSMFNKLDQLLQVVPLISRPRDRRVDVGSCPE